MARGIGAGDVGAVLATVEVDDSLRSRSPERYTISVTPRPPVRVRIASRSAEHPALATLAQLLALASVPCVEIDDWPKFPVRGFMLDISRDRVPTMASLEGLARRLSELKYNHLQLYTEHTFAYPGHEDVWRGCSPLTGEDVARVDGYARARGIELAANQNCFGHLARWLSLPRYAPLAEVQGEWQFFEFRRSGPFSLCPIDRGSIELVADLLAKLLPHFSSPLVNIGCDETVDVGQGRSKGEVEKRGRAAVYLEFLHRVAGVVRARSGRPMFWGDIALSHPESIGEIPSDMIALAWGYEADAPFEGWCERLSGLETWVCPGTSTWRSIVGRTAIRNANIAAAGAAEARGFLLTDWGDMGHRQAPVLSLPGLARGAQAAWNPGAAIDNASASALIAGDPGLFDWLDAIGDVDADLRDAFGAARPDGARGPIRNASALYLELHAHDYTYARAGSREQWEAARGRIEDLRRGLVGITAPMEELAHTLEVAALAAELGALRRRSGGAVAPGERAALAERLDATIARHRELWLATSRPGGLVSSCGHYERARDWILAHG